MSFAIPESPTIAINALAQKLKSEGKKIFNLSVGEPVIVTPQIIRAAAHAAIDHDRTSYPPAAGIPELRTAAARWLSESYSCSYTPDEIIITPGGKSALFFLLHILIQEHDEVMIIPPYWVSYPPIVGIFGGTCAFVPTYEKNGWKIGVPELERAYTAQTKVLILNNASNPTGTVYSKTELQEIVEWARKKGIIIISDEVYSGLVYDGEFVSLGSFSYENIFVVQSASKNFGMTGWRIGMLAGNSGILNKVTALLSQSVSGVSTISQWALLEGIVHYHEIVPVISADFKSRRDRCIGLFRELFGAVLTPPASGLYVFAPLSIFGADSETSMQWSERMLREAGVATIPGSAFGCEGYVRFSFGGTVEETESGLRALAHHLRSV